MIAVSPGYWRLSPLTVDMLPCPFPDACVGGNGNDSAGTRASIGHGRRLSAETSLQTVSLDPTSGCALGYQGPLCGVCLVDYYFDHTKQACLNCVGQGPLQLSITIIPPLIVLLVVLGVILFIPDMFKRSVRRQTTLSTEEKSRSHYQCPHLLHPHQRR